MKEMYDYRFKYKMAGWDHFVDAGLWNHYKYLTPEQAQKKTITIQTFDELVAFVEKGSFMNANCYKNLFGKDVVSLVNVETFEDFASIRITARNFQPFEICYEYSKVDLPIIKLTKILTASEFIEYLKDRGLSFNIVKE